MRIRNLEEYIKGRCAESSVEKIGYDDEPFLETIYGQGQELDSTIRDVASFASNSEEQLFYEFVQNAFDANADTLTFHFDEKYLIVLNNGEPFYTDPRIKKGLDVKSRDGQLYNFLAKGKSLKAGDESKSGEFGQGSKLLYTLISDKSITSNKIQLLKAIKDGRKGPYIVSWKDRDQLNNFRFQPAEWTFGDPHDGENELLIAKILMTYYPVTPGVSQDLFSNNEFEEIREAFERLVDPKSNINRLSRGTAIIVPLGAGQYEAISGSVNLSNVRTRLGGFASITCDKEKNHGRHLDHIYVDGKEVELHPVQSIFIEFDAEGEHFAFQFAFNPVFANEDYVNLFKTLPVLQAKYKFGFIIDSPNFELDSSRQRINDTDKTSKQLSLAFRQLLVKIQQTKTEDPEKFDWIYKSLIKSSPYKEKTDTKFICSPFYDTFIPFIRNNVRTADGKYLSLDRVRRPVSGEFPFPLADIGIEAIHWIDPDIKSQEILRYGLKVDEYSIKEALNDADHTLLSKWLLSLDKEDYSEFISQCWPSIMEDDFLKDVPVFRSNKDVVYTLNEVLSSSRCVFIFSPEEGHTHLDRNPAIEYIISPISYESEDRTSNNGTVNVMKVSANIEEFRRNDSMIDTAAHILAKCIDYPRAKTAIQERVPLLQDLSGNHHPFCELFRESPSGTMIYSAFKAAGYVPDILPDDLFINGWKDIWEWTTMHQEEIYSQDDWLELHGRYLKDLVLVYKEAGEPKEKLTLSLGDDGIPLEGKSFCLQGCERLDYEEYDTVCMFSETKGYTLIPKKFVKDLTSGPFETERTTIRDIIGDDAQVDTPLLRCLVKCDQWLLSRYHITADGDNFSLSSLRYGDKNYSCKVDCPDAVKALDDIGFHRIDDSICRFFPSDFVSKFEITTDNELMGDAIDAMNSDSLAVLFPIVEGHNDAICQKFFNKLKVVPVDAPLGEEDVIWQVIRFCLNKAGSVYDYKSRLVSIIRYKGNSLPATIKSNIVSYDGMDYDLYELLGTMKEESRQIKEFLDCLPDPGYFRSRFYEGKEETVGAKEAYDMIPPDMTLKQLEFCLHLVIKENIDEEFWLKDESEDLADALNMISRRRFKGFERHFKISGFSSDEQVFASHNLLLDNEIIPKVVEDWLKAEQSNMDLLNHLSTESSPFISIRKNLRDNINTGLLASLITDEGERFRTARWISEQCYETTLYSSRYNIIRDFITSQPASTDNILMFKVTGKTKKDESGEPRLVLLADFFDKNSCLIDTHNLDLNQDKIVRHQQLRDFFNANNIYEYHDTEFLNRHDLIKNTRFRIRVSADQKGCVEFINELYARWKNMKESNDVRIFLSSKPVTTSISVIDESTSIDALAIKTSNNLYGYNFESKSVIIQHPNKDGYSEMKTLAIASKSIDFFKDPFIALQGLFVELVENGLDPNTVLGKSNKKAEELIQKLGEDAVDKLSDKADVVKELVNNLSKEEMKIVADNKDKIHNLLEDISTDDEDTPESKVRKMIGYIGEQVYRLYLEKNGIAYEYSAEKGVGEYDFKIPGSPDTYLDVKTNLYTFVDAAVPFFIHKTQNRFMQMHPDAQYRIVRISLTDIRLKKEYEHIRNLYGPEVDFEFNDDLRKRCDKIARDYWKGAKIQEFDAASPEYGIRIERKEK